MKMVLETKTDDWLPTRRSLLTRLRLVDDHAGWQEFFDTYWRLLYGVARKAGLTDAEAQDAVQDCIITVTRQMPKFRYEPERCSFKGWLLMILRQRVGRQFRKRAAAAGPHGFEGQPAGMSGQEPNLDVREYEADPSGDPFQTIWDEEWQRHIVALATERVKKRVSDAQFQIFDLHVLRGWSPAEIAEALGVSRAQIYLAKLRVGRLFKRELDGLKSCTD